MKHCFRFLAVRDAASPTLWRLSSEEAHHLTKVVKLGVGAQVEVTDGAGSWASGIVSHVSKHEALVEADSVYHEPDPVFRIGIALGALRPASIDDLLAPLTELGLDRFVIFQQAEQAKARLGESVLERWRRILTNAVKQCKRARMPELVVCASLEEAISKMADFDDRSKPSTKLVADGGGTGTLLDAARMHAGGGNFWIVIGSEKGLDERELSSLHAAGFQSASLGPFVLRAQTAAYAAAACLALHRTSQSTKITPV